jgi:hypothetical protein
MKTTKIDRTKIKFLTIRFVMTWLRKKNLPNLLQRLCLKKRPLSKKSHYHTAKILILSRYR